MQDYQYRDAYDSDGNGRIDHDVVFLFDKSGVYTFSVQAQGDGVTYANSEVAVSDVWSYIAPTEKLATPEKLYWKDSLTPCWSKIEGAGIYLIEYSRQENGENDIGLGFTWVEEPEQDSTDSSMLYWKDDHFLLGVLDHYGSGNYYFRVRALSPDITAVANGDFSAASEIYSYIDIAGDLSRWNQEIADQTKTAAEAREELLALLPSTDLATKMVTEDAVLDGIASLEEAYQAEKQIQVEVDVSSEAQDAGVSQAMTITGAALNAESDNTTVTLKVTKPTDGFTADLTEYKNTVFVDMDLENVNLNEDGTLKVPVYITMPLPENITIPQNFRIVHYHKSDDGYDVITPVINSDGTVSFPLTHFSHFAFTELGGLKGDVNGDGTITAADMQRIYAHMNGSNPL